MSYVIDDGPDVTAFDDAVGMVITANPCLRSTLRTSSELDSDPIGVVVRNSQMAVSETVDDGDFEDACARVLRTEWRLDQDAPLRLVLGARNGHVRRFAVIAHHLWWDDSCWDLFARDLDRALAGAELPRREIPREEPTRAPGTEEIAELERPEPEIARPLGLADVPEWGPSSSIEIPLFSDTAIATRIERWCKDNNVGISALVLAAIAGAVPAGDTPVPVVMPVLLRAGTDSVEAGFGYFGNSVIVQVDPAPLSESSMHLAADAIAGALETADIDIAEVLSHWVQAPPEISLVVEDMETVGPCGAQGTALRTGITAEPITVRVSAVSGAVVMTVAYQPERVAAGVAHSFARRIERGISRLVRYEDTEPAALVIESSVPVSEESADSPVELIDRWALTHPERPALRDQSRHWTYRRLVEESRGIAGELLRRNPKYKPLAYAVPRGGDAVLVLLACLYAGIPVVELSYRVPDARLRQMLESAEVGAVIHGGELPEEVSAACRDFVPLWDLDEITTAAANREAVTVQSAAGSETAIIVHTSGTTGVPKPVEITHRGLARHAEWALRGRFPDDGIRLLHAAPPGFDASVGEVVMTLAAGGEVCCARPGVEFSPDLLLDEATSADATVLHGVPAVVDGLVREAEFRPTDSLSGIRCILVGGDRFPSPLLRRLRRLAPDVSVANCYGPTETTLAATMAPLSRGNPSMAIVIGQPRPELTAEILDERLQPVSRGEIGELYLSGDSLARGYRGMPAETANRFVAAPGGGRRYRTGDRASWTDAGLVCHGRVDDQMKIRGVRFEPDDVAAALLDHPDVRDVAIILNDDVVRAFVVSSGRYGPRVDLREYAARRLPEAIVPATVEALTEFPLTRNGKPDREALARRNVANPRRNAEGEGLAAPIAAMMSDCLGGPVSEEDSFFALGGHSLLVFRLVRKLEDIGVRVTMRDVVDNPTPVGLAELLQSRLDAEGDTVPRTLEPEPEPESEVSEASGEIPLTEAQRRMWVIDQVTDDPYRIGIAVMLRGELEPRALTDAVDDVVARHEGLRTSFPVVDGAPVQRIHSRGPGLRYRRCTAEDLSRELARSLGGRWDLSAGPPVRFEALATPEERTLLVVSMHHIVADHAALERLLDDIAEAYAQRCVGSKLVSDHVRQPRERAILERRLRREGWFTSDERWWAEELSGYQDLCEPGERDLTATPCAGVIRKLISPEEVAVLQATCSAEGVTPFATLLAEVGAVLAGYLDRSELVVGVPVSRADDSMVALDTDLVPVRLREPHRHDPAGRRTVFRALAEAIEHGRCGFDSIVRAHGSGRVAGERPLVRHIAQTRASQPPRNTGGLSWRMIPLPPQDAAYDTAWDLELSPDGAVLELIYDRRNVSDRAAQEMHDVVFTRLSQTNEKPEVFP
ncbi:AMP-binding protein [Corynebacterium sp. TAE3-ERU12]|uniref:AMP-binding protein n=1 Tax=Corynebacterium sp. TAE3-ERU12 TaxID=2849491 RepID=UPI001C47B98F|nr:AMP-binding protein [Corynebacterium sp. TAE3-ERU12]MBV7294664.1 AMP-binding protein [Corynebacterium sp. TAE3-ERU12]